MPITTLSSREFNHGAGRAKKAALSGPVFITDRGRLKHVLLSIEDYRQLTNCQSSIIDLLAIPADVDIDFEPVRLSEPLYKMAYFLDVFTRYQRRLRTSQSQVGKIRCKGDRMGGRRFCLKPVCVGGHYFGA